jgi:hypothetical protein
VVAEAAVEISVMRRRGPTARAINILRNGCRKRRTQRVCNSSQACWWKGPGIVTVSRKFEVAVVARRPQAGAGMGAVTIFGGTRFEEERQVEAAWPMHAMERRRLFDPAQRRTGVSMCGRYGAYSRQRGEGRDTKGGGRWNSGGKEGVRAAR